MSQNPETQTKQWLYSLATFPPEILFYRAFFLMILFVFFHILSFLFFLFIWSDCICNMLNCLYSSDNRKKKQVEDAGLIRCYGFLLTNTLDTSSVDNCLVLFREREKILYVLMVLFTLFFVSVCLTYVWKLHVLLFRTNVFSSCFQAATLQLWWEVPRESENTRDTFQYMAW